MKSTHLYKYFDERRWADEMLEGKLLFRSLAYFRDHEENEVRGDAFEGTSTFRPEGGLILNNLTQGWTQSVPGSAFLSSARNEEIFAFCLSRSLSDQLRQEFRAIACIEVLDVKAFCARMTAAMPDGARFPKTNNHERFGNRVTYYDQTKMDSPRWALPDLIAISKTKKYAWQDEFRLVFSLTNAFNFENAHMRLVIGEEERIADPREHQSFPIDTGDLSDICELHDLSGV